MAPRPSRPPASQKRTVFTRNSSVATSSTDVPALASAETASPVSSRPCSDGRPAAWASSVHGQHGGHGAREGGQRERQEDLARPARAARPARRRSAAPPLTPSRPDVGHGVAEDRLQARAHDRESAADQRGQQRRAAAAPTRGWPPRSASSVVAAQCPAPTGQRRDDAAERQGHAARARPPRPCTTGSSTGQRRGTRARRRRAVAHGTAAGHAVGMQPVREVPARLRRVVVERDQELRGHRHHAAFAHRRAAARAADAARSDSGALPALADQDRARGSADERALRPDRRDAVEAELGAHVDAAAALDERADGGARAGRQAAGPVEDARPRRARSRRAEARSVAS